MARWDRVQRTPFLVAAAAASVACSIAAIPQVSFLAVFSGWCTAHWLAALAFFVAVTTAALAMVIMLRNSLGAQNAQYKSLVEHAVDAVVIVDPLTLNILYVNAVVCAHMAMSRREVLALTPHQIFLTDGESLLQINARLTAAQPVPIRMRRAAENAAPFEAELRLSLPLVRGKAVWAYTARDISMQKNHEQQLLDKQLRLDRIANHDQLTGLPNRHYLSAFLPDAITAAKAAGGMLGVIFLDLDRFKLINDTQGHETGDKLLQVVSQRLRECVRQIDVVMRMGGDEFVIVLVNLKSYEEATRSAQRIIDSFNAPIIVDDRQLQTSASIGISVFPRDGADTTALLKHADTAMYQAKDHGRNNAKIFTPTMNRKLEKRVTVEAMLRKALQSDQLDVHYQPFINLSTRAVVGLEALIRWRHPTRGMIPADLFIPIAEETGLIIPVGEFVLQRTLKDMASWRKSGAKLVPVSLNVSPGQLLRGDFQDSIARSLAQHGFSPELLQIEMTERAIFDISAPQTGDGPQDSISSLRDLGIKIAIDDFGTGYSSLAYLKNWRVDTLKIDKSFVRDLANDSSDYAIVSAIIAMARQLRIEVIAEGIEAYQQDDILRTLGCHQGQGYLYARPLAAAKCLALLGRRFSRATYDNDDSIPVMALAAD